jgi:type I restriction enzyme S subunit
MDIQQFLANFKYVAAAPGGLLRLRQMILLLAVSGRLVPTLATDLSHSLWSDIELLQSRVNESLSSRRVRFHQPSNTLVQLFINAPQHWVRARLGDIGRIVGGGTPPKDVSGYFTTDESGILWLTPADLYGNREKYIYSSRRHLTISGLENSSAQLMPRGTVLFSSRAPIGYVVIAGCDLATNQGFKSVVPYLMKMSEFIYLYMRAIVPFVEERASGTTFKEVSGKIVSSLPIAFPSLDEQERIVAKVDELMVLCDKLEYQQQERQVACNLTFLSILDALGSAKNGGELYVAWRRLDSELHLLNEGPESVFALKKTVFDLAIKGNLSARAEGDLSVDHILFEVENAKKQLEASRGKGRVSSRDTPGDSDGPFELPSHWQWVRLGRLAQLIEYGTSQKAHEEPRGIPVLRMGNLFDGRINYRNLKYVADDIDDLPRLFLKTNDLIFNRTNSYELVGKMSIFEGDHDTFTFASYLIRVTLFAQWVNPYYINLYFQSSLCRRYQIEPKITVQTNQANFNGTKLKSILVPLPPLEEQNRIVESVNNLILRCNLLEQLQQELATSGGTLAASCVSAITGIRIEDKGKMKAPKTELISNLRIAGRSPTNTEQAPLTTILARHEGELTAKALWSSSGLEIDAFYQQLKSEIASGWIMHPEAAYVKELETV